MKKIQISPSILGVKKDHLSFVCNQLLSANSDLIHFDVMDGVFVDNKSFVEDEISLVSSLVNHKIIDVHLMCKDLKYYIPQYANEKVKYISIHYEAVDSLSLIYYSDIIRSLNIHPGIVINPETDVILMWVAQVGSLNSPWGSQVKTWEVHWVSHFQQVLNPNPISLLKCSIYLIISNAI